MALNTATIAAALFWSSGSLLFHTFAGYAWLMRWLGRTRGEGKPVALAEWPDVTCVVVAFNEADRIVARVGNLLAADYPVEKLHVLVVSDGSTDETAARVRAMQEPRVALIEQSVRMGKAAGLNTALAQCHGEIVVFADARQRFDVAAIRHLVRHFADPAVGAVSGSLEIEPSAAGVGRAVDAYWRMEKRLRADEARFDSCIGCTGAIYAIRRSHFTPIPDDTLLDDVVIPMLIAMQRKRVLHDSDAIAFDPQQLDPAREQARKRRTLAGNFQMLFRYPRWILPWCHRLWWQLLSHKYLRLASPLLLLIFLSASFVLRVQPFYHLAFAAQLTLYGLALIGLLLPLKSRLFSLPAGFLFLNVAILRALLHYLTGHKLHHWGAVKSGNKLTTTRD